MIEQLDKSSGYMVGMKLSGRLEDHDFQQFVPSLEHTVETHQKARLLVEFEDFEGWDAQTPWNDMRVGLRYSRRVERMAVVGDHRCEPWMENVCKPFVTTQVMFFQPAAIDAAWTWLSQDETVESGE